MGVVDIKIEELDSSLREEDVVLIVGHSVVIKATPGSKGEVPADLGELRASFYERTLKEGATPDEQGYYTEEDYEVVFPAGVREFGSPELSRERRELDPRLARQQGEGFGIEPPEFASVEAAEAADIPKGTIVIINGRRAVKN